MLPMLREKVGKSINQAIKQSSNQDFDSMTTTAQRAAVVKSVSLILGHPVRLNQNFGYKSKIFTQAVIDTNRAEKRHQNIFDNL